MKIKMSEIKEKSKLLNLDMRLVSFIIWLIVGAINKDNDSFDMSYESIEKFLME